MSTFSGARLGAAAISAAKFIVSKTGLTPGGHQRVMRSGAIGMKVGMSAMYDHFGARHPLTLIHITQCNVLQVKTPQRDGYSALQVGSIDKMPKRASRAELFHAASAGIPPKRFVQEFCVTPEGLLEPGAAITASHFRPGQYVDCTGTSIGKGFQGPMKRHGFKGQPATHGVSRAHRSHGSTGQRKTPGRTHKGKRMAGNMGGDRVTVLGLMVMHVDHVNGLIAVKGSVPGHRNGAVRVRDAIRMKQHLHNEALNLPVPTLAVTPGESVYPDVEWADTSEIASFRNPFMPPQ
uniref:Large ribosomal subunit protein uL3m n=1 Tax=Hemiselmis andersenii TaxID=464988 RepID=A0A6U5BUR3_HEMAN|mmetsp:Transcript_26974/g.62532  ORF Transcript_26974/g.62532 Transcript_26974/m.62532 type:complete len:292 (+) Transcript_26974:61-936(+)|eukprot:CAMPEP_0114130448 /NCGR_PEP_ID=MMETSP0043_2-20121206/12023_1 /TAXON_ID=464988 /ORGANISM="Hemiselmis andersenii, Strain CCMP644" /LENGTH=291 /DNA_ID=CAMNT_0001223809 /DNA_START=23 /DNA_END=898 /DNA_ORIENTATION=-